MRGVSTTSRNILDTGADPSIFKEKFVMTAWTLLPKAVKISRRHSALNAPMEVMKVISFSLQMGKLPKKIVVLLMPGLATNIILETAFSIKKHRKNQARVFVDYDSLVGSLHNHRCDAGEPHHNG